MNSSPRKKCLDFKIQKTTQLLYKKDDPTVKLPKPRTPTYLKTMFSMTEDAVLCVFKKKNLFLGTQFGGGAS